MSIFNFLGVQKPLSECRVALLPIAWEMTTSYRRGTYHGPEMINRASSQLDFYDYDLGEFFERGIHFVDPDPDLFELHRMGLPYANEIIKYNEGNGRKPEKFDDKLEAVNRACDEMVNIVYEKSSELLAQNKLIGLIGGDHSTPLGLMKALGEKYNGQFGVLHIDAHADLRESYQGFTHSHASIMNNLLKLEKSPQKLVQVGIRDFCKEEKQQIDADSRIVTFFDGLIKEKLFCGTPWVELCQQIVNELPPNVYLSTDIDGLTPDNAPGTGTPVPGGLTFEQMNFLFKCLANSGRKIIGFDLVEVGSKDQNDWDAIVGARVAFKHCGWMLKTNE